MLGDAVNGVELKVARNSIVDTGSAKHLEFVAGETYAFNCPIQVRSKKMRYFTTLHVICLKNNAKQMSTFPLKKSLIGGPYIKRHDKYLLGKE